MPVGETQPLKLLPVSGLKIGTASAGISQTERDDVTIFEISKASTVAAVFTKNKFCAAPVVVAKKHLETQLPRYLLINSGNANAGLGDDGLQAAYQCCDNLAAIVDAEKAAILPFSTGVIGEALPVAKLSASLETVIADLSETNWSKAATSIMTTDTRQKGCSRTFVINGETVTVTGIAKGSGMIRPDMATMLGYIATDASVAKNVLQTALQNAVNLSFNSITVDGDTSTNDAVVLIATGVNQSAIFNNELDDGYSEFLTALIEVCQFLAEAIVRDGEGANKLITVQVEEARSVEDAREVAYTVAHSPLVKTAFFAADPNWGRILAAVGRANISALNVNDINIYLDDVCIVREGKRASDYTEEKGQAVMNQEEIMIRICLAQGGKSAQILTCDLSYDYVRINAEYRS